MHADQIDENAAQFAALVLPNVGALSDSQVAAVRRFAQRGGGVLATGETSLFNEWGDPRPEFALANLFGAHVINASAPLEDARRKRIGNDTAHSYLRLIPERRAQVDGPQTGTEPQVQSQRHQVLRGFEETDILPFGGVLEPLRVDSGAQVLATFIPSFPIYPPETSWMREPKTDIQSKGQVQQH